MKPDQRSENPWFSSKRLLLFALLFILLAAAIASLPSVRFFASTFEQTMFTTAEFDANTEVTLDLPDTRTRYILAAIVEKAADQPPPTELTIRTPEGESIEYTGSEGWMSKFGNHYRRVFQFRSPEDGKVVLTAASAPTEDFVIFRNPHDVYLTNSAVARPFWIAAAVAFFSGILLIIFVICRKAFQKEDLRLSV